MLVLLSGVSGAGKDTIKKELIKRMSNVTSMPSYTDRKPREGEVDGQIYNFISTEEFKDIEVNGTENLLKLLKNEMNIVTIFLRVPKEELRRRLEHRVEKASIKEIELRLNRFDYEESKIGIYDYVLKNDDLEKTVQIIMTIIENEYKLKKGSV